MAPPSKRSSFKDIAGDGAEPCGDASSALSPILPMPTSDPAPPPPSKGVIMEVDPCVAASSPISAHAPSPPPLLLPDFIEVSMGDVDDQVALTIDNQTEKWEAMDEEQHVWNAIEEQQK
ncbi:hypothetical protein ZWY2020_003008 [Hordeum vulgare]|nr:hypothetical protein ZWY2020_003008 [Hordeum vulgare]